MLYVALVRWSVFALTLPLRLIGGEEAHEAGYRGTMTVVRVIGALTLVAVVIAALSGAH